MKFCGAGGGEVLAGVEGKKKECDQNIWEKYVKIKIWKAMIYNLKTLMGIVDNIEDEIHNVSSEKKFLRN